MEKSIIFAVLFSLVFFFSFIVNVHAQFSDAELGANVLNSADITRPRVYANSSASEKNLPARDLEKIAFKLLNERRAERGLALLAWSDDMAKIARLHSENMAKNNFFSHKGLDGLFVNGRADLLGVSRWRAIGENIAYNRGYENPAQFTVECWMKSDSHRENLLDARWKESAVGAAVAEDGSFYFTQVFILRK